MALAIFLKHQARDVHIAKEHKASISGSSESLCSSVTTIQNPCHQLNLLISDRGLCGKLPIARMTSALSALKIE